jgi:uncharacterized alkaline shock family protein YloU
MKVVHFFIHTLSVLVYLTFGSLLLIMALRIVAVGDMVASVRGLYDDFWSSLQIFVIGCLFICVGLTFAKLLIKQARSQNALVYQSRMGRVTVSLAAIEDIVKKTLKKFLVIKDCKIKVNLEDTELEIVMRLTLWSAMNIPDILREVQEEVRSRLNRVVGADYPLEIKAEVVKVEDHQIVDEIPRPKEGAVSSS